MCWKMGRLEYFALLTLILFCCLPAFELLDNSEVLFVLSYFAFQKKNLEKSLRAVAKLSLILMNLATKFIVLMHPSLILQIHQK